MIILENLIFICYKYTQEQFPIAWFLKTWNRLKSVNTAEMAKSKIQTLIKVGYDLSALKV